MTGRNAHLSVPTPCPWQILKSLKKVWQSVQLIQKHLRLTADQVHLHFSIANSSWPTFRHGWANPSIWTCPCSFTSDLLQPAWPWAAGHWIGWRKDGSSTLQCFISRDDLSRQKHNDGSSKYYRRVTCTAIFCCSVHMCSISTGNNLRWKLLLQLLILNLISLNCDFSAFTFINCYINL